MRRWQRPGWRPSSIRDKIAASKKKGISPDIVAAVLGGRQPPKLTARKLMDDTRLPLDWSEQRRALGFAQSH